jgi:hypothetical protein
MTKQLQIAQFLAEHVTFPRAPWYLGSDAHFLAHAYPYGRPRPSYEDIARELLAIPEFRALQLGTWLGTTDGQVIAQAVELVAPPFYQQDIELLVAALKLAAQLQSQEGQDRAGKVALGILGATAVIAVGISGTGRRAA